MVVTVDCIDREWELQTIILEFNRFLTPHTGDGTCHFIHDVINEWGLNQKLLCIATDNAADKIAGVRQLNMNLRVELKEKDIELRRENFHIRCIAYIINLAVKECMKKVAQ